MRYYAFYLSAEKQIIAIAKKACRRCYGRGVLGDFIPNYGKLKSANVKDEYLQREPIICPCAKFVKYEDVGEYDVDLSAIDFEKSSEKS